MLAMRLCSGFLPLMHGSGQTWLAEVIALEQVEPHAVGMSDFLALAATLRLTTGLQAKLAFDELNGLCLTSIREICAHCWADGRSGLHELTWRIDILLCINTDIRRMSPMIWAHNPCEGY